MMDEAAARELERLKELTKEPDWSDSETGELELWKNPHIPMRDRLVMADGGYAFLQKVLRNARAQLAESERQRKQLSEYIETLAKGGIEAATGAGK